MSLPVSVRVAAIERPTYVLGPLGCLPAVPRLGRPDFYPYAPQSDVSSVREPARHRVVVLENRYLRAEVLPDIGGRLYRLFDKTANRDVFEYTGVLKYQNIGNRGAWLSGGIEFNFGSHGHTFDTVAPVAWALRHDPDGGASIWVGATAMPSEARWALRIGLRPDRAVLDLTIHTMAPPILPALAYWWSNAAVEVTDASAFYYFGRSANDLHCRHSWPIRDGTDLRWYRHRLVGTDMFIVDADRDDMAYYDFDRAAGVASVADRFAAPGQKYYTWGRAPGLLYWDLLLSDTPGHAYAEIQRGRHTTQGDADAIPPMTADDWTEQWLPFHGTQGYSAAHNDLVLAVADDGQGGSRLHLVGLRDWRGLTVRAWDRAEPAGAQPAGAWTVARLAPEAPFVQTLPGVVCRRVEVHDAQGTPAFVWTEYAFTGADWVKPGYADPLPGPDTPDTLFAQAEQARFLNWPRENRAAQALYERALALDAGHVGTRQALAEIAFHAGDYAGAIAHLQAALLRAPLQVDLQALLGWAHFRCGEDTAALAAFSRAARNESGRRRGLIGLAWLHRRAGRQALAEEAVARLLKWNPADKWGWLMRGMLDRLAGRRDAAAAGVQHLQDEDPLWAPVAAEALLLGLPSRLGADDRCLAGDAAHAATPYLDMALWDDAAAVLRCEGNDEPFSPAVRLAHLLFVLRSKGDEAGAATVLTQLRGAPVEQAYPWTTLALGLLRRLAGWYPDEPIVQLMLGNALAGRGLDPESAWRRALALGLAHPVVFANLGAIEAAHGHDAAALELYREAARRAPLTVAIFIEVDRFLAARDHQADRAGLFACLPAALQARPLVAQRQVLQYLDAARYDLALDYLGRQTFYRGEWEAVLRTAYMEAVLGKALPMIAGGDYAAAGPLLQRGLEYSRNINIGRRPDAPNEAMINYWLGLVAQLDGRPDDACGYWTAAATEPLHAGSIAEAYVVLAYRALGDTGSADRLAVQVEQVIHGERLADRNARYFDGDGGYALHAGLLKLACGRVDEARQTWAQGLDAKADARLLRLHLKHIPVALLRRMAPPSVSPA